MIAFIDFQLCLLIKREGCVKGDTLILGWSTQNSVIKSNC